jgi:AraC-like DNA-binding protein
MARRNGHNDGSGFGSRGTFGQQGMVRVGPLVNIEPVIVELGCDPEPAFRRAGVPREVFREPDNRVSYLQAGGLIAEGAAVTGCDYFGLLVGRASEPSHLGIAGFLVRAAATTRQALTALVDNLDLHDTGGAPALQLGADFAELSFTVHQPGVAALDHIYDLCAAIMYRVLRTLCGDDWKATGVFLPRRRPTDIRPYKRLFRTAILFDSDRCAISFPGHWLEHRAPTADALLFRHLEQEAKALHELQTGDVTRTLPILLRRGLLADRYSAEAIAAAYGLQVRTFHRRLQAAGTTFRDELNRVRKTLSLQLLENTALPVCDIAHSLGYADSSGFIRAFHRWSGVSPTTWRRQNGWR